MQALKSIGKKDVFIAYAIYQKQEHIPRTRKQCYLVHQHHTYPESPLVLCVTGFVTPVTRMSRRLTMIVEDV